MRAPFDENAALAGCADSRRHRHGHGHDERAWRRSDEQHYGAVCPRFEVQTHQPRDDDQKYGGAEYCRRVSAAETLYPLLRTPLFALGLLDEIDDLGKCVVGK